MTPFQMTIVGLCFVINALDGMDILVIAFTAPSIAREWGLGPERLGVLFSSGLAGMIVGSLLLAPAADTLGRRKMILLALVFITAGMLAASLTTNLTQLVAARLLTGLGVGAMLPSINTQVAEYASQKRQSFAISVLQVGFPIGGTLGGLLAAYLVAEIGWRAVFVSAGLLSGIMIPVIFWVMPESLDFLLSRRPKNALGEANRILRRLGVPELASLPAPSDGGASRGKPARVSAIVAPEFRTRSVLIWICFFISLFVTYFILNWTPQILVDAGMPVSHGIGGGILLNVGGIIGALLLGFVASSVEVRRLVAAYMVLGLASMVAFALTGTQLLPLLVLAFIVGFFVFGFMIGLYAVVPNLYPAAIRTTGTGWAIGVGRFGAVAGPYVAGLLIAAGWTRELYYSVLALPLLVAAIAVLSLGRGGRALVAAAGGRKESAAAEG